MNYTVATVTAAALIASSVAVPAAVECRSQTHIVGSTASDAKNQKDGGHVHWHIATLKTTGKKTQFMTWTDFATAFTALGTLKMKKAAQCPEPKTRGSYSQRDCVDAKDVQVTQGQLCSGTDANSVCNKAKPITPVSVVFDYLNNDKTLNAWALVTAYPSDSKCD